MMKTSVLDSQATMVWFDRNETAQFNDADVEWAMSWILYGPSVDTHGYLFD